ncbi:hypothetical protein [Mycoplasmopsis alligatoris]|uniref:Conserved domain protein n=1 Tax=Mycoplasmopsis alligatoris A21JP2 TaxID=747682 RepID=D4XWI6_9BACT|nr:hypothetical protein [Mycoplasmopsis alligatoris]EFF41324.1 conserved domain protein [Mycoplasmopsis alligatoris A21JP2]
MSFLINVIGLNKEVAKALIIDSAREWNDNYDPIKISYQGHGIVPIKISDILSSKKN